MLRLAKNVMGYDIEATDGEIGSVKDFYFDDQSWTIRYLVADTGGWLSGNKVLLSPLGVTGIDWDNGKIALNLTRDQIENAPSINEDAPVSRQFERSYYGYYGWPGYWAGPYTWGAWPVPMVTSAQFQEYVEESEEDPEENKGDPHLRSVESVAGLHVQATDDEIGHVEDFVLDDESWEIRYLVGDTSNWWFGKKVLIAPSWVTEVNWPDRKVFVAASRDEVKNAPEFDWSMPVPREYEERLHDFYGRPGYWDNAPAGRERR